MRRSSVESVRDGAYAFFNDGNSRIAGFRALRHAAW